MESLDHDLGILKVDVTVFLLPCYQGHGRGRDSDPYKKDVVLVVPFKG